MRWGAVLGGAALAIGLWMLLQVLGMGLGLASVDTKDTGSLENAGIGMGIWSLIAPVIAMFIGAFLVGRLSGVGDRKLGAMHGSVMWALTLVIGLWGVMSVVSSIASGAARVGDTAVRAASSAIDVTRELPRDSERATDVARVRERAEETGLEAADKTGKALLLGGLMMLVSLGAAMAGGAAGARIPRRGIDEPPRSVVTRDEPTVVTTRDVPPSSVVTTRDVPPSTVVTTRDVPPSTVVTKRDLP